MTYDPYQPPHDHQPPVVPAPPQPYQPPPPAYPVSPVPGGYGPVGYAQPQFVLVPTRPGSATAVWALVLGIVGALFGWCLFALPCIAAVILGHVALVDTKDGAKSGRGMAVAGLVLGYVTLAPAAILFFWLILGGIVGAGSSAPPPSYP